MASAKELYFQACQERDMCIQLIGMLSAAALREVNLAGAEDEAQRIRVADELRELNKRKGHLDHILSWVRMADSNAYDWQREYCTKTGARNTVGDYERLLSQFKQE